MAEHDVARKEVTLSSKHQIVVPREARRALGLKPGDKLLVVTLADQVIVLRKPARLCRGNAGSHAWRLPEGLSSPGTAHLGVRRPPGWRHARTLALDTSAFIYHLESTPPYAGLLTPIFRDIEHGRCRAVASTLAFLEVLVQPSRRPDEGRRATLAALLASFPGIAWIAVDLAGGRPRRVHPGALSPAYARCDSPRHGDPGRGGRLSDERSRPARGQGSTGSAHRRASLGRYPLSAQPCMLSLTYALEA